MNRRIPFILGLAALTFFLLLATRTVHSHQGRQLFPDSPDRKVVTGVDYLGQLLIPAGTQFEGTLVGGLSAITYDTDRDVYYVLSDDQNEYGQSRFFTMTFDLADGHLTNESSAIIGVTMLAKPDGESYEPYRIDPEGIAYDGEDGLYISSERNFTPGKNVEPSFIGLFGLDGRLIKSISVPEKFRLDGQGVRPNLGFESLTMRPDGRYLFTAVENALAQDGPVAGLQQGSAARIIAFDRATGAASREFVYMTEPIAGEPTQGKTHENGLAELLALDNNGTFLALERSYSEGMGFTIRLFVARTQGVLDVSSIDSLMWAQESRPYDIDSPVHKEQINLSGLNLPFLTNIEGMTFGPTLADGRRTLILVADNNFNQILPTQFIVLALTMDTIPAALPVAESPRLIGQADPPDDSLAGRAADAAIWVHPTEPGDSLVITTIEGGGLQVLDLSGRVIQTIAPTAYGDRKFDGIDLIYNFASAGQKIDLAIVSDSAHNALVAFRIDPQIRQLIEVTSAGIPQPLSGEGENSTTTHHLATYTSPSSGRYYVFVSQGDGSRITQLELSDDGTGGVTGAVVRVIELPALPNNTSAPQAGGLVADRLLGNLFVTLSNRGEILKFSAEPEGGADYAVIPTPHEDNTDAGIAGATLYYGLGRSGYLLVSSQSDHTYALFQRAGDHGYVGRFVIGDNGGIDQATGTEGLDVINVALGQPFPYGLLVVQDSANEPQNVVANDGRLENNSTNFKLVPWRSVAMSFRLPLSVDTNGYDPRYPMRILLPTVSGD